jgi:pimeloyl-ACP methyl ester carboxylesterase
VIARRFAAQLPHATLDLLDGCGHAPWIDEPDLVATRLDDFFAAR